MGSNADDLQGLLIAASEADPATRIEYRDRIAQHGPPAVEALLSRYWIGDPKYAAFSIRAIQKAGELGCLSEATSALQLARDHVEHEYLVRDLDAALASLGVRRPSPSQSGKQRAPTAVAPMGVDDLVVGRCYRRRDLHMAGLGGNWQKGISYPSDGTYCLLFSDPGKESQYGYRDGPDGVDRYRYFGEWQGTGDMVMAGGNQAVVDRSPQLLLFVQAACGKVYRGQFACESWATERAVREGREHQAIVFKLRQVR